MNVLQPLSRIDRVRLRDGERCWLCDGKLDFGAVPSSARAPTIEHLIAKTHGGTNADDNLVLTHPGCNKQLGTRPVEDKRRLRAKYQAARERTKAARAVLASTSVEDGGRREFSRVVALKPLGTRRALHRPLLQWQVGAATAAAVALLTSGFAAGLLIVR